MAFIANQGIAPKGDRYDRSALVNDIEGKLYKRTEKGDFIYSSNNLETGSIGLNKYGNACISPVYCIFQPSGIADSDFLGRRLVRKDFIQEMVKWRQGVIYGQWRIHEADFLRLNIAVPSVDEQRLIGKLLDNLDALITLHQRKCQYRGLYGHLSWEQRKLGDIAVEVTRVAPESSAPVMMISTPANGFIYQSEHYAFDNTGESLKKYIQLSKGEMAYNHGASKLRPYGSCFVMKEDQARVPFVYHCFRVSNSDPDFASLQLNLDSMQLQLRKLISSGARMDGLLNISYNEYMSLGLTMPSLSEQRQIGRYFGQLDSLITLHQ